MLKAYQGKTPDIHPTAFVEASAQVIGDVAIGRDSSVWYNAVVRGDVHYICIGERTNIQDGVVVHGIFGKYPVIIEHDVSIGHNAVVHGCTVRSNCLIGMGAIILDNAEIGENCIIGAGALITTGTTVPPNSVVLGIPGKIHRQVTTEEVQQLTERASRYVDYKNASRP
ncbi:gamma carbonic anhydrase family protein [candidate division KSB3 bacterium]|uniref:Gamma carbonic anhydrase family protein n=1 Tax=candidate division KSB3 bacterium TaxID=2044937 RepID=A0A9D5Q5W5_9BACT|nr:gamma carbonic anhydrase family protein [candidate division KSB3 bacterium]MBD3325065.1 gamma carbonic anhydrase family protein [candidate division KSB3 bacterium]